MVVTFLLAVETGDLCEWGFSTSGRHGSAGRVIVEAGLTCFFIEQARDDVVDGEGLRGKGIKGDDECFIRCGEAGCENEDDVFFGDIDFDFFQLEGDATNGCNPRLHRL